MELMPQYDPDTTTWGVIAITGNVKTLVRSGLSLREAQCYIYDNDPAAR